jgi:hypothetical protein
VDSPGWPRVEAPTTLEVGAVHAHNVEATDPAASGLRRERMDRSIDG